MTSTDQPLLSQIRAGVERACKDFSVRVSSFGFVRTRKMFWVREREHTIEFIHLHLFGSSRGAPINASVQFRAHFGIRVLNDTFPAEALNGPSSTPELVKAGLYHLRFNASSGDSYSRCIDDLSRFVAEQGEPWFSRHASSTFLIEANDSPLSAQARIALSDAVAGRANAIHVAASRKLFRVPDPRDP